MTEDITENYFYRNLIKVTWIDSMTNQGWTSLDDEDHTKPLPTISSVGYLIAETPIFILLAADLGNDSCNRPIKIPQGCIMEVEQLIVKN